MTAFYRFNMTNISSYTILQKGLKIICQDTGHMVLIKKHACIELGFYETEVWDMLQKKQSIEQIIEFLVKKYSLKRSIVLNNVLKFIDVLKKHQIITFSKEKNDPLHLTYAVLEITTGCNLRCKHCYLETPRRPVHLSWDDFKIAIDQLVNAHITYIIFSGGEPLIHPEIFTFADYAKKRSLQVILVTNGQFVEQHPFEQYNVFRMIQISLDGVPAVHDSIRGRGTFDKAFSAGVRFKKMGYPVSFMMTVHKKNKDCFQELYHMCQQEGIPLKFERMSRVGTGRGLEGLTKADFFDVLVLSKSLGIQSNDPIVQNAFRSELLACGARREYGGCSLAFEGIVVGARLDLFPCVRLRILLGNLHDQPLETIWRTSSFLTEVRDRSKIKGKCGSCDLIDVCGGCRAEALAYFDDYLEEDPLCPRQ